MKRIHRMILTAALFTIGMLITTGCGAERAESVQSPQASTLPSPTPSATPTTTLPDDGATRTLVSTLRCAAVDVGNGARASGLVRTYDDGTIQGFAVVSDGNRGTIQPWNGVDSVTVSFQGTDYQFSDGELSYGGNTYALSCTLH
jgi:hypothetical protein